MSRTAPAVRAPELAPPETAPNNLPAVVEPGRAVAREIATMPSRGASYPPKIAKAIVAIMREIGVIEKKGQFDANGTKYNYQKWDDLLASLSPLLAEHGLIIMQSEAGRTLFEGESLVLISYDFTIVNEDGDEWPLHPRWSSVSKVRAKTGYIDDKAVNKCHTAASKYFMINLFKIKSIEVDDNDAGEPAPAPRVLKKDTRADFHRLQASFDAAATSVESLKAWAASVADDVKKLPDDWRADCNSIFVEALSDLRAGRTPRSFGDFLTDKKSGLANAMQAREPETVREDPADAPANPPDDTPTQSIRDGAAMLAAMPPSSAKAQMQAMDKPDLTSVDPKTGMPNFLKRVKAPELGPLTQPPFDVEQWLRDIEGCAGGCETATALAELQTRSAAEAAKYAIPTSAKARAKSMLMAHYQRIMSEDAS